MGPTMTVTDECNPVDRQGGAFTIMLTEYLSIYLQNLGEKIPKFQTNANDCLIFLFLQHL